jgi:hypothetical protein
LGCQSVVFTTKTAIYGEIVSGTDPAQRVKVSGHFTENTASKLIGVIPALAAGTGKVEIKTQYSEASNTPLKNLRVIRVIESPFVMSTPVTPRM